VPSITSTSTFARGSSSASSVSPGVGKSTLLFAIAQLLSPPAEITGGEGEFRGENLVAMTDRELAPTRWRNMSVVMQSAMNALNPVKTIGAQFKDVMRAHGEKSGDAIQDRSETVMRLVGIDEPAKIGELACALLDRALADRPGALRLVGVGVSGLASHQQLALV